MPKRYKNVSIPIELYEKLEKLVETKEWIRKCFRCGKGCSERIA
jgi:hypothetical protein